MLMLMMSMRTGHHKLSRRFRELDLADRILECGVRLAWTAWCAVLTVLGLLEGDLFPIRVAIDINIRLTHCEGVVGVGSMCCFWCWIGDEVVRRCGSVLIPVGVEECIAQVKAMWSLI
jgi:hypothetical protein